MSMIMVWKCWLKAFAIGILMAIFCPQTRAQSALFYQYCDSLIEEVDRANFTKAASHLGCLDSLRGMLPDPEIQVDYVFYKAYHGLYKDGSKEAYLLLQQAAREYDALGLKSKYYLAEAYQCVSLYVLNRHDESHQKSLNLITSLPISEEKARAIAHNIAGAVEAGAFGDPEKSLYHIDQALRYYRRIRNARRLISLYGIKTSAYNILQQPVMALQCIDSVARYARQTGNEAQLAFLQIRKARTLNNLGEYDQAIKELRIAEAYYRAEGSEHRELTWVTALLRDNYLILRDYTNAIVYTDRTDSLVTLERVSSNSQAVSDYMVKYETEKKELQLANERQRNRQLIIASIGGGLFLFLVGLLIYMLVQNRQRNKLRDTALRYQQQLLETTLQIQEAERKRISRDLHDGVGQKLSGLRLAFQQLLDQPEATSQAKQKHLQTLLDSVTQTAHEVRNLSHQMMPKALQDLGLAPAISDVLESTLPAAGIQYQFDQRGMESRLPEEVEIGLYRIVQELVNNIIKHAEATEVDVLLNRSPDQLVLMVEDNGKGFDLQQGEKGHGMRNMHSRLQAIRASLNLSSTPGQGTLATIKVALSPAKLSS